MLAHRIILLALGALVPGACANGQTIDAQNYYGSGAAGPVGLDGGPINSAAGGGSSGGSPGSSGAPGTGGFGTGAASQLDGGAGLGNPDSGSAGSGNAGTGGTGTGGTGGTSTGGTGSGGTSTGGSGGTGGGALTCDKATGTPYGSFQGSCYTTTTNGQSEVRNAFADCEALGTGWRLADVQSPEESDFISNNILIDYGSASNRFWTAHRSDNDQTWYRITSSSGAIANDLSSWAQSQLKAINDEADPNCVQMQYQAPPVPSANPTPPNWRDEDWCGNQTSGGTNGSPRALCEGPAP